MQDVRGEEGGQKRKLAHSGPPPPPRRRRRRGQRKKLAHSEWPIRAMAGKLDSGTASERASEAYLVVVGPFSRTATLAAEITSNSDAGETLPRPSSPCI